MVLVVEPSITKSSMVAVVADMDESSFCESGSSFSEQEKAMAAAAIAAKSVLFIMKSVLLVKSAMKEQ